MTETEIAAFVDGSLKGEHRATAMAHLAVCDECRQELAAVRQLVETAPESAAAAQPSDVRPSRALQRAPSSPTRRVAWWRLIGGIASVAAAIATVMLYPLATSRDTEVRERDAAVGTPSIALVAPVAGDTVRPDNVRFTWNAEDDATYRLTVTGSDGATLWEMTTTDTTVVMPVEKIPVSVTTLHWFVNALRSDGQSLSSRSQRLYVTTSAR